jgi:hypothetical protein
VRDAGSAHKRVKRWEGGEEEREVVVEWSVPESGRVRQQSGVVL